MRNRETSRILDRKGQDKSFELPLCGPTRQTEEVMQEQSNRLSLGLA